MTEAQHFHFDRTPFPTAGGNNYFYENRKQVRIIGDLTVRLRAEAGVYAITGAPGAGKSVLLRRIAHETGNNDFVVIVPASTGRPDVMRELAGRLGFGGRKRVDVSDVLAALDKLNKRGVDAVVIVDDAEELPEAQRAVLAGLVASLKFLRLVLAGRSAGIKRLLRGAPQLKERLVRKYRLKPLSFLQGIGYVNSIGIAALSLSQYRRAIGFDAAICISFVANRNMHNVNLIATRAIEDAQAEGRSAVGIRNVVRAARANFAAVRENIYLKFQKIFLGLVVLFCVLYAVKMVVDRQELIDAIAVHRSIAEQERLIQPIELE